MLPATRLPLHPDEITAEWVSLALQNTYPGTVVEQLGKGKFIGGTGSKLQLLLSYNQDGIRHGLPESMYFKGGLEWHEKQFKESFQAEAIFYSEWASAIPANIPKSYYAALDERQGAVLMEDLAGRNATFGNARRPLPADTVSQVLDLLARFHAPWWNKPKLKSLRSLGQRVGHHFVDYMLREETYKACLKAPQGAEIPKAFHDTARVLAGLKANWSLADTGPQTLCHGDPHQGNLFFEPDGTPGYLDFQAYVRSTPLHDVNYMIIGCMDPAERRKHDKALLEYYLEALRRSGVKDVWETEDAWERFRRHTMHGLMWFTTPEEMQPAEVVIAHGQRFGLAAQDYGLAGLLDV